MLRTELWGCFLLCLATVRCTGVVGVSGGEEETGNDPVSNPEATVAWTAPLFACDVTQTPGELPLLRLSRVQYQNSIHDLIAISGLAEVPATNIWDELLTVLAQYPDDQLVSVPTDTHGGFRRLDQVVSQRHVDVAYEVAVRLGELLTNSVERRTAVVGACSTNAIVDDDIMCLTEFINRFGARVLRRPLRDDDRTWLLSIAGSNPVSVEALSDVIAVMFSMPEFLYRVEEGSGARDVLPLDAFALAHRLSFHFWQTIPDDQLWAAADSGDLLTDSGYAATVERLLEDPRTDGAMVEFFSEWFRTEELPPLNILTGTPVYDAFTGDIQPSADLHEKMNEELGDLIRWLMRHNGSLTDVLSSRLFVAQDPTLAAIYGQAPWDGQSDPILFAEPQRAGLITRAAFLATGSGNTRPVMKGFRIRNGLLCEDIPPPPNNANANPVPLSPEFTTRETVEALTEQPGSSCSACHSTLLNPMGFLTENFDAIGRFRTEQRLFEEDGSVRTTKPINTSASPQINGVMDVISDANTLTRLLSESGGFHACFARQYFRFAFSRIEDDTQDGCVLRALQVAALADQPLREVLASVARRPEFKRKDFR